MARFSKKYFVRFNIPLDAYRYYIARSATSQPKKLALLANLTTKIYCVTKETGVYAANTPRQNSGHWPKNSFPKS